MICWMCSLLLFAINFWFHLEVVVISEVCLLSVYVIKACSHFNDAIYSYLGDKFIDVCLDKMRNVDYDSCVNIDAHT